MYIVTDYSSMLWDDHREYRGKRSCPVVGRVVNDIPSLGQECIHLASHMLLAQGAFPAEVDVRGVPHPHRAWAAEHEVPAGLQGDDPRLLLADDARALVLEIHLGQNARCARRGELLVRHDERVGLQRRREPGSGPYRRHVGAALCSQRHVLICLGAERVRHA